ncbi:MAG: HAD family hydrolase [Clostridiaceae bacterium]|nr:HAD family hydrolase [Clostridiaceae bacterium]
MEQKRTDFKLIAKEKYPQIIALDVDGTLVPHGGIIGEKTKKILKDAKDKGIEVVLVTARPPRWLDPVMENLGFSTIAICANGAITVDTKDNSLLDIVIIIKEHAIKVVSELKKRVPDVVFAAESLEFLRAAPGYEDLPEGVKQAEGLVPLDRYSTIKNVSTVEEMLAEDVYKIVAETFEMDVETFYEIAQNSVGDILSVTRSVKGRSYIEFGPLNLSKAEKLAEFSRKRNVKSNNVIAFGDMLNDMDMIQWAGIGVAMANGHEDVKKIADIIAPSADNDGIAYILEQIL